MNARVIQASREILHTMQAAKDLPPQDAVVVVNELLTRLEMQRDVQAVPLDGPEPRVELQSISPFGKTIMEGVSFVSQVPPCPEGECDFEEDRADCMWCGSARHRQ